jgi:enoyl-CoA hydratase
MNQIDLGNENLIFEVDGPLAWLIFNRPEARNAMTFQMYDGLVQACEWVDEHPEIRVFLLKGAGDKAFVAGTDISQFQLFKTREDILGYEERMDRVLGRLERVGRPTIAVIRGYAVGGGGAIAAACDMRIGAPDMQFGFPVARTLGNCLNMGNYARLVALIGPSRTKELLFTARMVGAEEALRLGLVNEVVPAEGLEDRVRELAASIAANAPLTLRASKEAVRRLAETDGTSASEDLVLMCYQSEDFREGVTAFMEKRKPTWKGQ